MGFRFRKSIKIMPGVRVNVSKSGFSTSVGGRGATMNVSKRGVRTTVGIPGSGLSYSTLHAKPKSIPQKMNSAMASVDRPQLQSSDSGTGIWKVMIIAFIIIALAAALFS